jgi:hypothetical protein
MASNFRYVTNLYVTDVPNIVKIDLCANYFHGLADRMEAL